jgi:hypothetical protein
MGVMTHRWTQASISSNSGGDNCSSNKLIFPESFLGTRHGPWCSDTDLSYPL